MRHDLVFVVAACLSVVCCAQPQAARLLDTEAIRVLPTLAPGLYMRGRTLERLHRLSAAADDYRSAVELEPQKAHYQASLGVVLFRMGKYQKRRHASVTVRRRPSNSSAARGAQLVLKMVWKGADSKASPRLENCA
jgi:hypothetical protein